MPADLKHLRVVIAAADCGSFSSAALQLNAEVSAISRAIREIEDQLGVALFERQPRGVRLTAAGQNYVASAREILERFERAGLDARLVGTGRALHLSVGYPWSAASKPLVELLRSFAADFPTVAIEVVEAGNPELIDRLRSGRLDVALAGADPPPLPRLERIEPLAAAQLWLERLVAVLPKKAGGECVNWKDCTQVRLLCRTIDDWPRFVHHIERLGGPRLAFEPHAVSQQGVLGLVAAGLGWTVIPMSISHLLPETLKAVPISSAGAELLVEALWRPENINPALTPFLALCRQLYPADGNAGLSESPDP